MALTFKEQFPLLARHEGVWDGTYRLYNAQGDKIDEHRSRLLCTFPTSGAFPYVQANHYSWADGRKEVRGFPAVASADRIIFKSELIDGWAADVALDQNNRTTMLHWQRLGEPGVYLYEMIQIADDGCHRSRVWQWFSGGRLFQRTLIDEEKITANWQAVKGESFFGQTIAE